MRLSKVMFLWMALLLLGSALLFAGGQDEGGTAAAGKEIVMMHDKGGVPNFQPQFEAAAAEMLKDVGVTFTPVPYPSTDVFQQAVRSGLPTSEPPDMFTWWSTYRSRQLYDQDVLADLTHVWDKHKDEYAPGLRDAFTFDGKVYGYPYTMEYWPVYYNKEVFAKLGLSVPETWDEFIKICDALKAQGIVPLMQTVQARWPTFIMFEEMIIGEDPDLYVDLCEGRVKYTDPRVKKAFGVWKDMMDKGYFSDPSTDLFADGPRLFNEEKIAMGVFGTWYYATVLVAGGVPEEKIGLFILPSHNPDAGKNIIFEIGPGQVAKNSQSLERVYQIVDWLMSSKGNGFVAEKLSGYAPNMKADTSYLPREKVDLLNTIIDENYRVINRYWEATPSEICETAVDKLAEFIMKPESLDKVLADLDKVAEEYFAKQ